MILRGKKERYQVMTSISEEEIKGFDHISHIRLNKQEQFYRMIGGCKVIYEPVSYNSGFMFLEVLDLLKKLHTVYVVNKYQLDDDFYTDLIVIRKDCDVL